MKRDSRKGERGNGELVRENKKEREGKREKRKVEKKKEGIG